VHLLEVLHTEPVVERNDGSVWVELIVSERDNVMHEVLVWARSDEVVFVVFYISNDNAVLGVVKQSHILVSRHTILHVEERSLRCDDMVRSPDILDVVIKSATLCSTEVERSLLCFDCLFYSATPLMLVWKE